MIPADLDRISRVLPWLYVGSYGAAENVEALRAEGITHAVCLLDRAPDSLSIIPSICLSASDHGESDLGDLLARALPLIEEARGTGGRVLVFCALGVNRSPALAAAYLLRVLGDSASQALERIAASRPFISLHEKYLEQLERL